MKEAGLDEVKKAKADGRWERAYDFARLMALTTPRRLTRLSEIVYDLKIRLAPP